MRQIMINTLSAVLLDDLQLMKELGVTVCQLHDLSDEQLISIYNRVFCYYDGD